MRGKGLREQYTESMEQALRHINYNESVSLLRLSEELQVISPAFDIYRYSTPYRQKYPITHDLPWYEYKYKW